MPEGDTIFRAARTLRAVLEGRMIVAIASPLAAIADAGLVGRKIESVEARGKNLTLTFDDRRVLHTHMRMDGAWHLYHPGEPWKRAAWRARVVLEVSGAVAVCFDAPIVRLLSASLARSAPELASLGPDLLAPNFDPMVARANLRARGADGRVQIADALLDQSALAGIGNVFKCEVLFVEKTNPFCPIASLTDDALDAIIARAKQLMVRNIAPGQRMRTVRRDAPGARFYVYGRSGQSCFTCGTRIAMRRQGPHARSTYFCPTCQNCPEFASAEGAQHPSAEGAQQGRERRGP